MLASVATERAVWVVQSSRGDRFGSQHRLGPASQIPQSLASAWLGGESTLVAWTSANGPTGVADPRTIYYAAGLATRGSEQGQVAAHGARRPSHRRARRGAARIGSHRGLGRELVRQAAAASTREIRAADVGAHPGPHAGRIDGRPPRAWTSPPTPPGIRASPGSRAGPTAAARSRSRCGAPSRLRRLHRVRSIDAPADAGGDGRARRPGDRRLDRSGRTAGRRRLGARAVASAPPGRCRRAQFAST